MQVLIRADGGPGIGFGHLMRTKVLASELNSRGHQITYVTETKTHTADICGDIANVVKIPEEVTNRSFVINSIENYQPRLVILDSLEADIEYQRKVRRTVPTLAHFQHYDQNLIACDILINGSLYAKEVDIEWFGKEPAWCRGLDYVLLREPFQTIAKQHAKWRPNPCQAVIIMGGSDVNNTTPAVMRHVDKLDPNFKTVVVVGPGFDNYREIRETASQLSATFGIKANPPHLPELMFESDFAISATGTTIYELIATQTPVVGKAEADNQQLLADTLADRELAITLRNRSWGETIAMLANDKERRQNIFESYDSLIDGKGHVRIARVIEEETAD